MKVPETFKPNRDLEKEVEELLKDNPKLYKLKTEKDIAFLKLRVVKDKKEFLITYSISDITGRVSIFQPDISEERRLNELLILADKISFYHNGFTRLRAVCKERNGKLEGRCAMPLQYHLTSRNLLEAIKDLYPSISDEFEILEIKHKQ